jgi:putative ABC transport system substrate-binding protein
MIASLPGEEAMRELRRREVLTLLCGVAMPSLLLSRSARAQASPKRPTIAWISGGSREFGASFIENFLRGMKDLVHVEGRTFDMVYRFTEGYQERLPAITAEVVRLNPDIILATAAINAVAARKVTSTIPIVTPALADAVHLGLIASEARPGGNVTGIEPYVAGLPAKQIEFAREIVPGAGTIGLLTNLKDPKAPAQAQELEASARAANIKIAVADANHPDHLEGALASLGDQGVDVVIVLQTSMLLAYAGRIAASALQKRLPTVYGYREHVIAGGLISYGVDLRWCFYRGAYFVDRILKGTPPGELPIEFPTQMFLALNLKTASTLGITVPPMLIARADEVIE